MESKLIDKNLIKKINESKKEKDVNEAMQAIELVSNAIDSIMSGRQIDIVFYRKFADRKIKNLKLTRK